MLDVQEVFDQLPALVQRSVLGAAVLLIAAGVPIAIWFFVTKSPTARLIATRLLTWTIIFLVSALFVFLDPIDGIIETGVDDGRYHGFWAPISLWGCFETVRLMLIKPRNLARTLLGLVWLAALLVGGWQLSHLVGYALVLLFVVALFDIGGWVGGKTLAKLKPFGFRIFKKTSPNKTLGGLVVSFVLGGVAWVWVFGGGLLFGDPTANLNLMAYLGLAAFAVLGDWLASKLKRLAKVKDAGAIIVGFGGVLDRFDSIIWVGVGSLVINFF